MCEFCIKHGDGKKWYLNVKNYSLDLLSDLKRRRFIREFTPRTVVEGHKQISLLEARLAKGKHLPRLIRRFLVWRTKSIHYGQVVPLEDVERIFEMTTTIVAVPCVCRWEAKRKEAPYCFPVSIGPPHWFEGMNMDSFGSPDVSRLERLDAVKAMERMRAFDRHGLIHTVWTFGTPFIGAICNCDRAECLAMRSTVGLGIPMILRAEYVAEVAPELCVGCRQCARLCQFGAVGFSLLEGKSFIDPTKCYGCGVCRSACQKNAIRLIARTSRQRKEA